MNFNSHTDTVVGMAVALVNLLTPGEDRSRPYEPPAGAERAAALNALFKSAGSRSRGHARGSGGVRSPSRPTSARSSPSVAAGDIDSAAHRVNDLLAATGAHPALDRHDGEPWHIHFHSADETSLAKGWAAGCATGLAIVLGGELLRPARRVHGAAL